MGWVELGWVGLGWVGVNLARTNNFIPTETKPKSVRRIRRHSAVFLVMIVTNVTIGLWRVNPTRTNNIIQ